MKKFSKITAVILTVLLLCGLVATFAVSASESNQLDMTGSSYNLFETYDTGRGTWTAYRDTGVDEVVVKGAGGNNYLRFTISAPGVATKECLTDGKGAWNIGNAQIGPGAAMKNSNGYAFTTFDFDLGTDSYYYSWTQQFKNLSTGEMDDVTQYSTSLDDIPEGVDYKTVGLAYPSGFYIYARNSDRGNANSTLLSMQIKKDEESGLYYATSEKNTSNKIFISSEVGVFDHITFVIQPVYEAGAMTSGIIYCYVNGELLYKVNHADYETRSCFEKLTFTYEWKKDEMKKYFVDETEGAKNLHGFGDKYSTIIDNYAVNFYSEGDANTAYLNEFFGNFSEEKSLMDCAGVVYTKNYLSPNGYIAVDGVKSSFDFDELLATVKDGSVIETTFDMLDYKLPEGVENLTVKALGDAKFSLSSEFDMEFLVIPGSNNTYTVRRATDDDYISLKWVYIDEEGNETVLDTTDRFSFGHIPTPDLGVTKSFDFDELKYYETEYVNWTIDVDGDASSFGPGYSDEVNLYDPEPLRALTAMEILLIREELGGELKVVATEKSHSITDFSSYEFIIGTYDDTGLFYPSRDSKGEYDQYDSMENLAAEISAAESGSYVLLAYDVDTPYELGGDTGITIPAGKTINFDLNGRTLVQSYDATSAIGNEIFILGEGTTFNLYSSKAGAAIYQAKYYSNSNDNENSRDYVTASGIIKIDYVNSAVVNVGDVYDADGNKVIESSNDIAFYGGTFISVGSRAADEAAYEERLLSIGDGKQITINVNGGTYYQGVRSAIFTVMCPDVYINLNDATFINATTNSSNSVAGIFRDEADDARNSKYYASASHVFAKNCVFVAMKDGSTTRLNLYSKMNNISDAETEKTTAYFEDCVIIAKNTNLNSKNITVGPGCTFAGASHLSKVTLAEGTKSVSNDTEAKISITVSYPMIFDSITATVPALVLDGNGKYILNNGFFTNVESTWRTNYVREYEIKFTTEIDTTTTEGVVDEIPTTQSGVNVDNNNGATVDTNNTVDAGNNEEVILGESNPVTLTPATGATTTKSESTSDYTAWIAFAVSMIAIAIAVVMLSKRRSKN